MRFWLVTLGLTAIFIAGSVALAGNPESTKPKRPVTGRVSQPKPVLPQPKPVVSQARNGLIAATATAKGTIVLVNPSNGRVREVPGTEGMDKPAWSPDGTVLAVQKDDGDVTSVYTIRTDGTHTQLVLKDASSPSWSEDGSWIFAERDTCSAPGGCDESEDETITVSAVRPDGTGAHQLGEDDVYDPSEAGWPPASHVLEFLEDEGSTTPSPSEVDSSQATWSPDGFDLAFADASTGLWIVSVDGGKPELVAAGAFATPSWGNAATARAARSARR